MRNISSQVEENRSLRQEVADLTAESDMALEAG